MPKKLRPPTARIDLSFMADRLMIKHDQTGWHLRARQVTPIGTTWVTLAKYDSPHEAQRVADTLADGLSVRFYQPSPLTRTQP